MRKHNLCFLMKAAVLAAAMQVAAGQQPPAPATGGMGRGGPGGAPLTLNFADRTGFEQIFDGKSLEGWDGAREIWRVENGVIVAESTPENPAGTTFLIWRGGVPADFELKLEIKIEGQGGNSGVQYRSRNVLPSASFGAGRGGPAAGAPGGGGSPAQPAGGRGPGGGPMPVATYSKWNLFGPQADFDMAGSMAGQLFEGGRQPGERGITTRPGQVVVLREGQPNVLAATIATADELKASFKPGDWNQYHIVVRGRTYLHILNGRLISVTIDDDNSKRHDKGLIGLQIEGASLKVSFRDIWLKRL